MTAVVTTPQPKSQESWEPRILPRRLLTEADRDGAIQSISRRGSLVPLTTTSGQTQRYGCCFEASRLERASAPWS